jgi:putative tryptophan/tyrosine transport system substrate-binding protein
MRRRTFITLVGGTAAAWPLAVRTQQSMPVIGVLVVGIRGSEKFWRLFREDLSKRGYVEGKTVRFEFRSDQGKLDQLPALARDLAQLKPDVIVTWFTPAATAAAQATREIPIVMAVAGDPRSHRPRQESLPAGGKRDWDVRRGCGAFQQAC